MKFVPDSVVRHVSMAALKTKKNSPHILFGVGVAGMVVTTVTACRATLKLEEVLEENKHNVGLAKDLLQRHTDDYTDSDYNKDMALIYTRSVLSVTRLYGPSVAIGVASIGCLVGSHTIMNRRNAALVAAYATIEKSFAQYRDRVAEAVGEERELDIRHNRSEETVKDEETGKASKVKVADPNAYSQYAKFFDQLNENWRPNAESNRAFLRAQQQYATDLLNMRGHLTLNDVYDMLGIERTKAGFVVGWVMSPNSDNFVDFGLYADRAGAVDFINGREGAILLDFNVDGVIYDKI